MWSGIDTFLWWLNLIMIPLNLATGMWGLAIINAVGFLMMHGMWRDHKRYTDILS